LLLTPSTSEFLFFFILVFGFIQFIQGIGYRFFVVYTIDHSRMATLTMCRDVNKALR